MLSVQIDEVYADRYRIVQKVGSGAFASVYEALDRRTNRTIALKISNDPVTSPDTARRVLREIAVLRNVTGRHVVDIYDAAQLPDGRTYLVMELVDGPSLAAVLEQDPPPWDVERVLHLAAQMCRGLTPAHQLGVVHRDLKPENLLFSRDGVLKVVDFGLARSWDRQTELGVQATVGHVLVGTPHYSQPEQMRGGELSPAADVYSMAFILYELLFGHTPFDGESTVTELVDRWWNDPVKWIEAHAHRDPIDPRELTSGAEVPAPLVDLLLTCLRKSPESRPADAGALAAALEAAVGGNPVDPSPAPTSPHPPSTGPGAVDAERPPPSIPRGAQAGGTIVVPAASPEQDTRLGELDDPTSVADALCEELKACESGVQSGRIHHELAVVLADALNRPDEAAHHFEAALENIPDHLPAITAARRLAVQRRDWERVVDYLDAELGLVRDGSRRADLLRRKGAVLRDELGRADRAREAFTAAIEADPGDLSSLRALARAQRHTGLDPDPDLARAYARVAQATHADQELRAFGWTRQGELLEGIATDDDELDLAVAAYERAVEASAMSPALGALRQIHARRGDWRALIGTTRRELEATTDPERKASLANQLARLCEERLDDRARAREILSEACGGVPNPAGLSDLARLAEWSGEIEAATQALLRWVEHVHDRWQRVSIWHHVGRLNERLPKGRDDAISAYEAALAEDPTHVPTLRALSSLYTRAEAWSALIRMHLREAEHSGDTTRRARAHARAADLLERREGDLERAAQQHEAALRLNPTLRSSFTSLSRLYRARGEYRRLLEVHQRALDVTTDRPTKVAHLFAMGDLYDGPLQAPLDAYHTYRRVLEVEPNHVGAWHAMQRAAESAGRHDLLIEALELEIDGIQEQGARAELMARIAEVQWSRLGDREAAVEILQRARDLAPGHPDILALLATSYHDEGRTEALLDVYEAELQTRSDAEAIDILVKIAEVHEAELRDSSSARRYYERALQRDDRHPVALSGLIRLAAEQGAWEVLADTLVRAIEHTTDPIARAESWLRRGEICEHRLDRPAEAADSYEAALSDRPGLGGAIEGLCRIEAGRSNWQRVAETLEQGASSGPEPEAVRRLLRSGSLWRDRIGDVERARATFRRALEIDPSCRFALEALADIERAADRPEELAALDDSLIKCVTDIPTKVALLRERLGCLRRLGREDDVLDTLTTILTLVESDREALEEMARIAHLRGDQGSRAQAHRKLAELEQHPALRASHLASLGEALEAMGHSEASKAYAEALELDPSQRVAARGLGRLAQVVGDSRGIVTAARRQADLTVDPQRAADLLAISARESLKYLDRPDDALEDLSRALERFPDHEGAGRAVLELAERNPEANATLDTVERAARECRDPARQRALLLGLARIQNRSGRTGVALATLRRLESSQPQDPEGLLALARMLTEDRQHAEALERLSRVDPTDLDSQLADDYLRALAQAHRGAGQLDEAAAAMGRLREIHSDDIEVLQQEVDLLVQAGRYTDALAVLTARSGSDRESDPDLALVRLRAGVQLAAGLDDEAFESLSDLVAADGLGDASKQMLALAFDEGRVSRYLDALDRHLETRARPEQRSAIYLEQARVAGGTSGDPRRAVAILDRAAAALPSDAAIRTALAHALSHAGEHERASTTYRQVVTERALDPQIWRNFAASLAATGHAYEAALAGNPLVALRAASPREAVDTTRVPALEQISSQSLTVSVLDGLSPLRDQEGPTVELTRLLGEGLGRLKPPALEPHGLGSDDRLTDPSPTLAALTRLCDILGMEVPDTYLRPDADGAVQILATAPPTIVIPAGLVKRPKNEQVFALANALVTLARGLGAVEVLTAQELAVCLAAAARTRDPAHGRELAPAEVLETAQRQIQKGVPWRRRKAFAAACASYVSAPPLDLECFVGAVRTTSRRIATILAGDLDAAVVIVARERGQDPSVVRSHLAADPELADLFTHWMSPQAMGIRRTAGLLHSGPGN